MIAAAGAVTLTPVPESDAVCGLAPSPPLYDTLKVGVFAPAEFGLNFTVKVQEALAASEPPAAAQDPAPEFVIGNSAESVSEILMLVAVVLELFVSVNVTGELDELTLNNPKLSDEGESVTVPPAPETSGCG
jgi:hypothetical protein